MTFSLLLGVVLSAVPALGFVQANDWYERASAPAHFQPLLLVDGDLRTAWCAASSDAQADALTLGFSAMVAVDEVRIGTGNQAATGAFHASARPRKFVLRTDGRASTFTVADTEGLQTVKLDAPLQGTVFTLEVLDVEPAEDPAASACVSEVQLVSHGKPIPDPKKSLLVWNPERAKLLGIWYSGDEGNPDQSLAFFVDGSWQLATVVYGEPTRPKTTSGTWGLDKKGLWMKAPGSGKGRVTPQFETKADARGKGRTTLQLKGGVPATMRVPFRDRK
jgi:hypothetical protein